MNEMARLAHQTATGEGEGVPAIEPPRYRNGIINDISFDKACPSNCDGRERGYVFGRTSDACQPRTLSEDRGNTTLERRGIRMSEPSYHCRDERVGPIPTPFSYAYITVCNQAKIAFRQIAGGKGVETAMVLLKVHDLLIILIYI